MKVIGGIQRNEAGRRRLKSQQSCALLRTQDHELPPASQKAAGLAGRDGVRLRSMNVKILPLTWTVSTKEVVGLLLLPAEKVPLAHIPALILSL